MQKPIAALLLTTCLFSLAPAADDALTLPTSAPAVVVTQATAGDVRLIVWETAAGIEAQALNASTHVSISGRLPLGAQDVGGDEPQTGEMNTRPAVAALPGNGEDAVFFVAWHAALDVNGVGIGTEIVGQRVVVDAQTGNAIIGPLLRVSRVDDDTDASAASEARSAPVVVANPQENEFAVFWTQRLNSALVDYFVFGQEFHSNGEFRGEPAWLADSFMPSRDANDVVFLAAAPFPDGPGYLLAWSDPAQEDSGENLAQLYTKRLPEALRETLPGARNDLAQSTSFLHGIGRLALAPLPNESGFLLAWEDARGTSPLRGQLLNENGEATSEPVKLLDLVRPGDDAFLSPQLLSVPEEGKVLLYAAVGTHGVSAGIDETFLDPARVVRRTLDPASAETLEFLSNVSETATDVDAYPSVNVAFANQAHVAGMLPDGNGAVSFAAKVDTAAIVISEFLFAAEQPPPPPPPSPPDNGSDENKSGGGALFTLLFLLPFIRSRRTAVVFASGLLIATTANASPPDLELLHSEKDGAACYRSVMYREVSEIRLAKGYNKTPVPAGTPIEVVSLPSGWKAEVLAERNYQYVRLTPSPFDTVAGISIGRICLKFPAMEVSADVMSYTYDLVATGSPIMATARADDGVSDDELRAMVKRGERLKKGDILDKPKEIDNTLKTLKRAKDLFN